MSFCQKFQKKYHFLPQDLCAEIKALAGSQAQGNEYIAMYNGKLSIAENDSAIVTKQEESAFNG